jgi:hypothetical protein
MARRLSTILRTLALCLKRAKTDHLPIAELRPLGVESRMEGIKIDQMYLENLDEWILEENKVGCHQGSFGRTK